MKKRKKYNSPEITEIKIDNEISLALESVINSPGDPGDDLSKSTLNLNKLDNSPFKA